MPRVVQVPDIRKVDLPEARQAIPHVHAYLRECILNGTLSPGTKLSQVSLAAQLGISRTPLRVLTDCAPDFVPVAVPHAVALIDRQPPAGLPGGPGGFRGQPGHPAIGRGDRLMAQRLR